MFVVVSSRTDLCDDDVVDVTSFSALDVVEINKGNKETQKTFFVVVVVEGTMRR